MEDKFYKRILKGDHIIWVVFFTLCCISMIEVFSASSALTYETGDHLSPIKNHCVMLMVGIAIAIAVHHIPVRFFKLIPFVTLPLSVILLAASEFVKLPFNVTVVALIFVTSWVITTSLLTVLR